jgi:hypothetical protein
MDNSLLDRHERMRQLYIEAVSSGKEFINWNGFKYPTKTAYHELKVMAKMIQEQEFKNDRER